MLVNLMWVSIFILAIKRPWNENIHETRTELTNTQTVELNRWFYIPVELEETFNT